MKLHSILTLLALAFTSPGSHAQSDLDREFTQLQEQHEKALAAAAEPVNRRHQIALESLLRRATQARDLQTANKVNAQLSKLAVTLAHPFTVESLTAFLVGTKWTWFGNETLTFLPDGKAKWKDGEDLWPWKVTSGSRRVIASEHGLKGRKFTITFDREMKTGIIEGDMATRKTEILTAE
jgi:hypothetical protein